MSWQDYGFMKSALLAVLIISPLFALLGTMIVNKKMAYFSDALGHCALTGIAVGVICGFGEPTGAMLIFSVVFALLLNQIAMLHTASTDTIISVFSSCAVAIGLIILSRGGNFSRYSGILVGDILSISRREIVYLLIAFLVTIVFWTIGINALSSACLNRSLAKSRQIPVRLWDNLFAVLLAVVVTLSIRWVGILLINALLILPAASAKNMSSNMRQYHFFAVLFSLFSGVLGLFVSYYLDTAAGPTIVIAASVIYFATFLYERITGK